MTRTRISFIASTALASILGAALPALAQAPIAPAPAVAPGSEAAVMPAAPMMAPRGSDDMTGSVGFGTGVTAGTNTLIAPSDTLILKYWLSDVLAVVPSLTLAVAKASGGGNTEMELQPSGPRHLRSMEIDLHTPQRWCGPGPQPPQEYQRD